MDGFIGLWVWHGYGYGKGIAYGHWCRRSPGEVGEALRFGITTCWAATFDALPHSVSSKDLKICVHWQMSISRFNVFAVAILRSEIKDMQNIVKYL